MDLLSSPDPLNASVEHAITPSYSRRVTRSQTSSRFTSLAGSSPRKQTFELDVGDVNSPQKILVTVEAEETDKENVSRRLFGTPTPKRSVRRTEKATTTTVPLKGLTDDESGWRDTAATPRRRGRPPKNATPSTQTRKKTPAKPRLTPGRPRRTRSTTDEVLGSEISVATDQATPKASASTRRTTKRKTAALPTDDEQMDDAAPPKRRGRKRRQAIAPEDVIILEDHTSDADSSSMRSNSMQPDADMADEGGILGSIDANGSARTDHDIWMTGLEDTQRSMRRTRSRRQRDVTPTPPAPQEQPAIDSPRAIDGIVDDNNDAHEFMQLDDHSDVESNMSEKAPVPRSDQDTVVDGENFTMISMDSVPSLQAQLHLPSSDLPEMGETTSLIISNTLESLRQSVVLEDEESDPLDGGKTPTAVSPAKSTTSVQNETPRANASALSVSGSPLSRLRSPRRSRAQPLGRQLALKSLQRDDQFQTEELGRPHTSPRRANAEDVSMYEDSFSEIPEAVLEAATPRRLQETSMDFEAEVTEELEAEYEPHEEEHAEEAQEPDEQEDRPMTSHSSISQAESSRLLTPDETPSPTGDSPSKSEKHTASSRVGTSEPRSSPPVFNLPEAQHSVTRSWHSRQNSTETPKALSLSLPSTTNQVPLPQDTGLAPLSSGSRPALSPIVRAGRTLQSIMSDPPSPSARGSVLGSPFQGSQRKSSPIVMDEPSPTANKATTPQAAPMSANTERSWSRVFAPFSQLKNIVAQGTQTFSPHGQNSQMLDDPFGPSPSKAEQPEVSEDIVDAQQKSIIDDRQERRISAASSARIDLRSEDEMSWVADSNPFITAKSQSGNSSFLDKEQSFRQQSQTAPADNTSLQNAVQVNDEDIWAVEAQRPTPALKQVSDLQDQPLSSPKKGLFSSLWGARSLISLPNSTGREQPSPEAVRQPSVSPTRLQEEYSLLSLPGLRGRQAVEKADSPVRQEPAKPRRVDLSAFFSSSPAFAARFRAAEPQAATPTVPRNEEEPSNNLNGFGEPVSESHSVPQKDFTPSHEARARLFAVGRENHSASEDFVSHSVSPATPERPALAHVPQKRNFTPLLGQSRSSLFAPSPAVVPEVEDSPMEEDTDEELHESSRMTHESDFEPPVLKPLPGRSASPTKSCLRSPLKPKTPGRVVEFTSSVLSPLAQAQARAERRNQFSLGSSIMGAQGTSAPAEPEKENPRSGLSFSILATPKHRHLQQKQADSPLSQSRWTKKHWIRLDELLQQYRRAPLEFQLKYGGVTPQKRKSNVLLGKQVSSQGENMLLEQWHLDVVDAFKKEVGGWNENELAKRLFAVMVGEERRRLGLVPKRR